jgi:hypothetical protein
VTPAIRCPNIDAVTPAPEVTDYLLLQDDRPVPRLRVYPRYTVIAEKFEAIVSLGINTRAIRPSRAIA